jgi:run domain Beclin-1 interacting cysteine-rich containing protein
LADGLSPDLEQCGYLVFNPEWTLFSLHHLILLHQGELIRLLKNLLSRALKHVSGCQLCQARGFVCEVCRNGKDIIFPFQVNKCIQCRSLSNCLLSLYRCMYVWCVKGAGIASIVLALRRYKLVVQDVND